MSMSLGEGSDPHAGAPAPCVAAQILLGEFLPKPSAQLLVVYFQDTDAGGQHFFDRLMMRSLLEKALLACLKLPMQTCTERLQVLQP